MTSCQLVSSSLGVWGGNFIREIILSSLHQVSHCPWEEVISLSANLGGNLIVLHFEGLPADRKHRFSAPPHRRIRVGQQVSSLPKTH